VSWLYVSSISASDVLATRLTEETIKFLPPGGMDAIGGIDDWFLTNGTLCAVISAKNHGNSRSMQGGILVDLWHCKLANDQWVGIFDHSDLYGKKPVRVNDIKIINGNHFAGIQVNSSRDGVILETVYTMDGSKPQTIRISQTIRRESVGESYKLHVSTVEGLLIPYYLDVGKGEFSTGFKAPDGDVFDHETILDRVAKANLLVLMGTNQLSNGIAYGMRFKSVNIVEPDGNSEELYTFLSGRKNSFVKGFFTAPFLSFSGEPTLLSQLYRRVMDLGIGDVINVEKEIIVGKSSDAASVTDLIYQGRWLSGILDSPKAGIEILDQSGTPLSFVRPDETGYFRIRLPKESSDIQLKIMSLWNTRYVDVSRIVTDVGEQNLGLLETGGFGRLLLPSNRRMKLLIMGVGKTESPLLLHPMAGISTDGIEAYKGDGWNHLSLAGAESDPQEIYLPEGRYKVLASRGLEYSLAPQIIELKAGSDTLLIIPELMPEVDSKGMVAADLHVHSGISDDSDLPPRQRVADFIAQGGEVLVSTEHNVNSDMRAIVSNLNAEDVLTNIPGIEVSGNIRTTKAPETIGHASVFPVQYDAKQFQRGALQIENKRLGQVIGEHKSRYPTSLFQLNHPRTGGTGGYFNHLSVGSSFNPDKKVAAEGNYYLLEGHGHENTHRDIDFDAIELLNGKRFEQYEQVREDWFSLLNQGYFKVGTANSDSHSRNNTVALPRNYVHVENDAPAELDIPEFLDAIRFGKTFGTTGPMLRLRFNDAGMGEVFTGSRGKLIVRVDAASWVGVDELRIFVNGKQVDKQNISPGEEVGIDLSFSQDSYIVVEARGNVTEEYAKVFPGFFPLAFSNPIFIDVDGDGTPWR